MPQVEFNSNPAVVVWPVTRGDDENMPLGFFTTYISDGHASNVPLDITGRTYSSKVARSRGGAVVVTPTVTVTSAVAGELTVSMTDTQTDLLTASTYIWDLVENAGTSEESTLIVAPMRVSGRATV